MKWIFSIGAIFAVFFGIISGKISQVSTAAIGGGAEAVKLFLSIAGAICFWSGVMKVAQQANITSMIAKLFKPILNKLFRNPSIDAIEAASMNISANLLGLGNAATPFGIEAMKRFQKYEKKDDYASHNMILFCVINTAALQIIPTTISTIRLEHGSVWPMKIMLPMLLSSLTTLLFSIIAVKIFARFWEDKK
ncbi:MAG: spore maturation protein A [Oscillospiraceae bacterium]|nr:spore maturation protein A [Oscillospiraceae bacterium]